MLGYVKCKKWEYYGEKAIPTGEGDGTHAKFILPYVKHSGDKPVEVWLTREEIYV